MKNDDVKTNKGMQAEDKTDEMMGRTKEAKYKNSGRWR